MGLIRTESPSPSGAPPARPTDPGGGAPAAEAQAMPPQALHRTGSAATTPS